MDQANAQAVKSFKRCVLAAAASTTSSEALGHIASGKAYIRVRRGGWRVGAAAALHLQMLAACGAVLGSPA